MRTNGLFLLLAILPATFLAAAPIPAGPTATLTGRITDRSGAVIAGVKVEATNVQTNNAFAGETNSEGLYNIPDLPPGTYLVTLLLNGDSADAKTFAVKK